MDGSVGYCRTADLARRHVLGNNPSTIGDVNGRDADDLFSWVWSMEPPDDPWSVDYEVLMTRSEVAEHLSTWHAEWADPSIATAAAEHLFGDEMLRREPKRSNLRQSPLVRHVTLSLDGSGSGPAAPVVLRSIRSARIASDALAGGGEASPRHRASDLERMSERGLVATIAPREGAVVGGRLRSLELGDVVEPMVGESLIEAAMDRLVESAKSWDAPRGLVRSTLRRRRRILEGNAPVIERVGKALAATPWVLVLASESDRIRHLVAPSDPWCELTWAR